MRQPLNERVNGEWTVFEALLFNLITEKGDRNEEVLQLFSERLEIAQKMLDVYDACINLRVGTIQ